MSSPSFVYWPYDEVALTKDAAGMVIQAPWLRLKVRETPEVRPHFETLAEKSSNQTLSQNDLPLVNAFFQSVGDYPLCYIVPTPKEGPLDTHTLQDSDLVNAPLDSVLKASGVDQTHSVLEALARTQWGWDAEAAIGFARMDDKVHPESLFSVGRRYHLLEVLENDRGNSVFDFVQTLPPEEFAQAASLIVRQNHYVTEQCQSALQPATSIAKNARSMVEEFMQEERGHDRILSIALQSMGREPSEVAVSPQTEALISILRFAASRNFLGFALIVDFFERSSYEATDPLAQLLEKGGFSKAAKQINAHMEINDSGGHENVARGFLRSMAACSPEYATEALRLAETASLVMNSVTASAVTLYQSESQG